MVRGAEWQGCAIYGYIRSPSRQRPLCANSSRSPFTKQRTARDIQNKTFAALLSGNPVRASSDRRKKHPHRGPMKRDGRQQDPGSSGQPFGGRATAERLRALGLVGRVICHGPRSGRGQQSASWPLAFSRQEIAPRSQRVQAAISPVVQSSSGGDIRPHFFCPLGHAMKAPSPAKLPGDTKDTEVASGACRESCTCVEFHGVLAIQG